MAFSDSGRESAFPPVHESVRRNRRWGCACGCLVFLFIIVFGVLGGTWWVLRPQPSISRELLIEPGTVGHGVVRLTSEDTGVRDMISFILRLVEDRAKNDAISSQQAQQAVGPLSVLRSFLTALLHAEATITMVRGTATETNPTGLDSLFTLQTRNHLGTLIAQSILGGITNMNRERIGTGVVLTPSQSPDNAETSGTSLGWRGNLILISNRPQSIRQTIERVEQNRIERKVSELEDLLDQIQFNNPPEDQDLAFAVTMSPGLLRKIVQQVLASLKDPQSVQTMLEMDRALTAANLNWDDARGLTVTGDVVNADSVKLELRLLLANPDVARKALAALQQLIPENPATTSPSQLQARRELRTTGSILSLQLQLTNIRNVIRTYMGVSLPAASAAGAAVTTTP